MTVKELIERLSEFPPDAPVGINDHGEIDSVDEVRVITEIYDEEWLEDEECDETTKEYMASPILWSSVLD